MNLSFTSQVIKEPASSPELLQGSFWEVKAGDATEF